MNFEVNLIFLIKPFFLHDSKVMTKTWLSWGPKELLRWNKKYFSSFLKGIQWSKSCKIFWKVRARLYLLHKKHPKIKFWIEKQFHHFYWCIDVYTNQQFNQQEPFLGCDCCLHNQLKFPYINSNYYEYTCSKKVVIHQIDRK